MPSLSYSRSDQSKWLQYSLIIIISVAVVLSLIPIIAKHLIISTLSQLGAENVSIDNIDINPFTAGITVEGFIIQGGTADSDKQELVSVKQLHLNIALLRLIKKQIFIEEFSLNGVALIVEEAQQGQYKIGILLPLQEQESASPTESEVTDQIPFSWGIGLANATIENIEISYQSKDLNSVIAISSANITEVKSWAPDIETELRLAAHINSAPFTLQAKLQPFAQHPKGDFNVTLQQFQLTPFRAFLPHNVSNFDSTVSLELTSHMTLKKTEKNKLGTLNSPLLEQSLITSLSGNINLNNNQIKIDTVELNNIDLKWQGKLTTHTALNTGHTTLTQNSILNLNNLNIALTEPPVQITNDSITWEGITELDSADPENSLKIVGSLDLKGFTSSLVSPPIKLANIEQITLSSIDVSGLNKQHLQSLEIKQSSFLKNDRHSTPVISYDLVRINEVQLHNLHQLHISDIVIEKLESTLHINQEGQIVLVDDTLNNLHQQDKSMETVPSIATTSASSTTHDEKNNDFEVNIKSIEIDGQSRFRFIDESVKPVFNTTVALKTFKAGPVIFADNTTHQSTHNIAGNPHNELTQSAPTTYINFSGIIDNFSSFSASGEIQAFAKLKNGNFKASLSSIELPPLSPYASKTIGYNLESGQLNSELNLSITDNILNGHNKVLLANLNIDPEDEDRIDKLTKKISMPLDLALSILKNKKGDIEINMPIKGDLNSPQINVADIITTAIAKAVKKASLTYLKFALQPYGAAIMILEKTAEWRNEIRLNPIDFQPNSIVLTQSDKQYMDKIASILDGSPGLRIRLCSISTPLDLSAYEEKLIEQKSQKDYKAEDVLPPQEYLAELGRLRALTIKNHLIEQHSIEAKRLFICHPIYAKDEGNGSPRTEIRI